MRRQVLVVDDSAINRQVLANTLKKDYAVIEAACGEEALERLQQNNGEISAMLLDIVMTGIDGYEVLRRIRSSEELAQIPVIMVTGSEDEESRVKAISFGANDLVVFIISSTKLWITAPVRVYLSCACAVPAAYSAPEAVHE